VSSDPSQPIVVALISALGGVIAAAFAALVSLARRESRNEQQYGTPPLGERTAVLEQRANDSDEQLDLQDRRIDVGERRLDRHEQRIVRLERQLMHGHDNDPGARP
jgi:hypothetical protein